MSKQACWISGQSTNPSLSGAVHTQVPGIKAWKDTDPTVSLVAADYTESGLTARFWVAGKATNNGNGTWHYEYAVYNLNANRSAGAFTVPVSAPVVITNPGFETGDMTEGYHFLKGPFSVPFGVYFMTAEGQRALESAFEATYDSVPEIFRPTATP